MEHISWEELVNYNKKTNYKNRPIIIVELDDDMNKKYNAIVVKYDDNKNVHIRYLDNPFYEDKYWWSGNKDNLVGLNPLCYHAKALGDDYDEMDGLVKSDFQEDGYDDIVNYSKEPHRFYKSCDKYPYLNGIQGNVHVNNYYISNFNQCLSEERLPECIERKLDGKYRMSILPKVIDVIYYGILEQISVEKYPLVMEYNNKNSSRKGIIKQFKKMLSMILTNYFIRKYKDVIGMESGDLLNIKGELWEGNSGGKNVLKVLPYLLEYNIVIFDCNNNDMNVERYVYKDDVDSIYFIKYLDRYYSLIKEK